MSAMDRFMKLDAARRRRVARASAFVAKMKESRPHKVVKGVRKAKPAKRPRLAPPEAPATVSAANAMALDRQEDTIAAIVRRVMAEATPAHITPQAPASFEPVTGTFSHLLPEPLALNSEWDTASLSTPISASVSDRVKAKIWTNQYFDFAEMFAGVDESTEEISYLQLLGPRVAVAPKKIKPIATLAGWNSAFLRFVAIRCERFPAEAVPLMKYGEIIGDLARRSDYAWRYYDRKFRQLRQTKPAPWDKLHTEYFLYATVNPQRQVSSSTNYTGSSQPFRRGPQAPSNRQPTGFCNSYNDTGFCSRPNCKYQHICRFCNNRHPVLECRKRQQQANSSYDSKLFSPNQNSVSNSIASPARSSNPSATRGKPKPASFPSHYR